MDRKVALQHVDRAYGMLERVGCFLTYGVTGKCEDGLTRKDARAAYARVLEAQRAVLRAMRELNGRID